MNTRAMKLLLSALLATACAATHAQSVMLVGAVGNRAAILIVNGGAPMTVGIGQTLQGVKLVAVQDGQVMIEAGGQRTVLRMDTPVSVGGSRGGSGRGRIVLSVSSGGHFLTQGAINGRAVSFLVDTGASVVALSASDAQRIGLDYTQSQPVRMNTANGLTQGYRVRLNSVRVGDVEVYEVDAVVTPQPMPHVLLGNSFINRFSMQRDASQMVLEERY
jgi:aspartyl protease family protein